MFKMIANSLKLLAFNGSGGGGGGASSGSRSSGASSGSRSSRYRPTYGPGGYTRGGD